MLSDLGEMPYLQEVEVKILREHNGRRCGGHTDQAAAEAAERGEMFYLSVANLMIQRWVPPKGYPHKVVGKDAIIETKYEHGHCVPSGFCAWDF